VLPKIIITNPSNEQIIDTKNISNDLLKVPNKAFKSLNNKGIIIDDSIINNDLNNNKPIINNDSIINNKLNNNNNELIVNNKPIIIFINVK